MLNKIDHQSLLVFEQLRWVLRRRERIIAAVKAHFGATNTYRVLERNALITPPIALAQSLEDLIDARPSKDFLRSLAFKTERFEAHTIHSLRTELSVYQSHVEEQILFGARTAGQDAAREFLNTSPAAAKTSPPLPLTEAVNALFQLSYLGFPEDKNFFFSKRPSSGISAHFIHSPHQNAWKEYQPAFLHAVQLDWMRGILEILSTEIQLSAKSALELGHPIGLYEFQLSRNTLSPTKHANL